MNSSKTVNRDRRLDVLISTFSRDGIMRVANMNLPAVDGVNYIVSWQTCGSDSSDIPECLCRDDIHIFPTDTTGISINRNLAMSHAEAPVCLTADDDLIYRPEQLRQIIEVFDDNPDLEVASFMYEGPDPKPYPDKETDLVRNFPKNFWSAAFEIAYRTDAVRGHIKYDENFGPGDHPLKAGEDSVFLLDCIRARLDCRFFPIVITIHPGLTTGHRPITDKGVVMADGAYIRKAHGLAGIPRLPLFVWRNYRNGRLRFWWGMRYIFQGFFLKLKY